jgi:hypothetical protein
LWWLEVWTFVVVVVVADRDRIRRRIRRWRKWVRGVGFWRRRRSR